MDWEAGNVAAEDPDRTIPSSAAKKFPPPASAAESRGAAREQWVAGYRILRKIGEGGMGVVFEAEQQTPRRAVALKVIRGGAFVDEHTRRLFQREVESLARLKHPSIAAIYEAGATDDGQRFFAMELVCGVPLDEYARDRPLDPRRPRATLRARLKLFLQICTAINYAHQRGVIHRDLKPGNILVVDESGDAVAAVDKGAAVATAIDGGGDDGTRSAAPAVRAGAWPPRQTYTHLTGPAVKILDFGLARISDRDAPGASVVTQLGQVAGTLAYMSPEQARGNPDEIDLRTDVYSLGVVFFELLTGELPYATTRSSLPEAIRVICETAPRRPSEIVATLDADLETILLKALEKEPARRYQSVFMLAEDIERYLADQPILARPPSTLYQMRKLIARHKTPFAFGVALFTLLVGFAVTMSIMFGVQRRERLRADAARARAELETRKAGRINEFLRDMLASIDPEQAGGREVTVREVLDRAAVDVGLELESEPEVAAAVRNTIGTTYLALGLYEEAERQLRTALAAREELLGATHGETIASLAELGHLLNAQGHYAAAESVFTRELAASRVTFGAAAPQVAAALNNLGLALRYQGHAEEAEPLFRESLAQRRTLLGAEHRDVAASLNNLALTLSDLERYDEAEPLYREALATQTHLLGDDHLEVARTSNNLALLLRRTGHGGEALRLYDRALAIQRKSLGDEHPSMVVTLMNLAALHRAEGDPDAAARRYREALAMAEHCLGADHPHVAMTLVSLGGVLRQQGSCGEAEQAYRRALEIYRQQLGEDHPYVPAALGGLATVLLDEGRAVEAEAFVRRCLELRAAAAPSGHWRLACDEILLADCLAAQGRTSEAESLFIRSAACLAEAENASPDRRQEALSRAVVFFAAHGMEARAREYRDLIARLGD